MRTAFAVIFLWVFALCGNELGELLRLADESNPVIQSQRAVVEQTLPGSQPLPGCRRRHGASWPSSFA